MKNKFDAYTNMIYPGFKTPRGKKKEMSVAAWGYVQDEARKMLAANQGGKYLHPANNQHAQDILAGRVPYGYKVVGSK